MFKVKFDLDQTIPNVELFRAISELLFFELSCTHTHTHACTHTHTHTHTHTQRKTQRHTDGHTDRHEYSIVSCS